MDDLYEWMRNFTFYMMIITVAMQLLPNHDYKKYIRFFSGLILILMMIGPILKVFNIDALDTDYEQRVEEIERATEHLEEFIGERE